MRQLEQSPSEHHQRRRLTLWLLGLTGMAALTAWTMMFTLTGPQGVDAYLLPVLMVFALTFWVLLRLGRMSIVVAEMCVVVIFAAQQQANLLEFTLNGRIYAEGFGGTSVWFPLFYPLTFMLVNYNLALRLSLGYLALAVVIFGISLPRALESGWLNGSAINTIVQFYLANVVYVLVMNLYAQYRQRFYAMRTLAQTDSLTGLANRRLLEALIEDEQARADGDEEGFAVLMLDLDHFKKVNDVHGHAVGDEVLREIAHRLLSEVRGQDTVGRLGGEEFLVVMPRGDALEAQRLAEHLRRTIETRAVYQDLFVTVSVGIALYQPGEDPAKILARADSGLYRAKRDGRNRVAVVA
jgi:diguanylate cyclase